jgi:DNA-binding MarR family transcriptional regulator
MVLKLLVDRGSITVRQLEQKVKRPKPKITGIIKQMEAEGFIRTEKNRIKMGVSTR